MSNSTILHIDYQRTLYEEMIECFKTAKAFLSNNYDTGTPNTIADRFNHVESMAKHIELLNHGYNEGCHESIRASIFGLVRQSLLLLIMLDSPTTFTADKKESFVYGDIENNTMEYVDSLINSLSYDLANTKEWTRQNKKKNISMHISNLCQTCYMISEIFEFDILEDVFDER